MKAPLKNHILLAMACAALCLPLACQVQTHAPEAEFDIVMVPISPTTWASIKYNTETGEAWEARDGKWIAVEDKDPIPKSKYTIKMTGLSNDWSALRFDTKTGRTWQCKNGQWEEISHFTAESKETTVTPGPAAAGPEAPRP